MEDRELVRRIQNGQKEYLNEIAGRYYDDIYYFCCYQSGNREDAYDLAQETFLRFIRYVGQYKYVNLKGYLLTIAMNVCRNYFRDRIEEAEMTSGKLGKQEDAEEMGNMQGANKQVAYGQGANEQGAYGQRTYGQEIYGQSEYSQLEYSMILKDVLAKIPEAQREAVLLHHFYGYKNREIARMTGASCAAVKSRVSQGLAQLHRLLEKEELYE